MREKLGVLLMEDASGEIAVQLFADPDKARESFAQLIGKSDDKPQRATFLQLDYKTAVLNVSVKDLPIVESKENSPDGYRLGEGPIYFDKKMEDKDDDSSGS